jgi:thiol reductant ABC exporter CydC subunit
VLTLAVAVVGVRAFGLTRGLSRYVERLAGHDATLRVLSRTRSDVWTALEPLVPAGLPGSSRGDLLERLVGDVEALQDLYLRALAPPVVSAVVGAAAVAVSAWLLPPAGVALAVGLVVAATAVPAVVVLVDRRAAGRRAPARSRLTAATVEALTGAADLEACGAAEVALDRVAAADEELRATGRSAARAAGTAEGLQVLGAGLVVLAVLLVGVRAVDAGSVDGVTLAVVVLIAWACQEVTAPLPDAARALVAARAAAVRLLEVLDAEPPVADPVVRLPLPDGPLRLQVRDLVVRYPGAPRPALDGVDLELPPGRRVALVGPSGSGKSTLVDVLLRFREPGSGTVRLGGVDVRACAQDDVRRVVSGCLQNAHVFATTLLDNLLLARPDATRAQVEAAAQAAGLTDWVASLPRGWQTPAGEAGAMLSGGQAQRLALARALLADPPVLLLDEPTAGLDRELADAVTTDVLRATRGRTLLLVTHRLTGLDEVDEVDEVDGGRVVQRGRAAGLRAVPGLFQQLERAEREADALLDPVEASGSPVPSVS